MPTLRLMLDAVDGDARYAIRGMRRRPGWTITAILTLAVGLAATASVFTVVNALMLHPLFYGGAERVFEIRLRSTRQSGVGVAMNPAPAVIAAWRQGVHSFDALEPIPTSDAAVTVRDEAPILVRAVSIQPSFLSFANQRVILGRGFDERDYAFTAERVVLLGERFWRAHLSADPGIIDFHVSVDGEPTTVIGVTSRDLHVPGEPPDGVGIWRPYDPQAANIDDAIKPIRIIGRLRQGVSEELAREELDRILSRTPGLRAKNDHTVLTPLWQLSRLRESLRLLAAAVALVLILACGNVAHLLLARGLDREREMRVRTALGATIGRLWQWLVVESLIVVIAGYALGMALAEVALGALLAVRPDVVAELDASRLDARVLIAALLFSLFTAIVFATLQVMNRPGEVRLSRWPGRASSVLRDSGRGMRLLIVTEAGIAFIIMIATLSLVRAVSQLQQADPGFHTRDLVAVRVRSLPNGELPAGSYMDELAARLRRIPGVVDLTFASQAPPEVGAVRSNSAIEIEGQPPLPAGAVPRVAYNRVAGNFFAVTGTRLLYGSVFTDTVSTSGQVIISEATARQLWPRRSPVGSRFRLDGRDPWSIVVGVVADVAAGGLAPESREPVMYLPLRDHRVPVLLVRTRADAAGIAALLRQTASSLDRRLPEPTVVRIDDAMAQSIARPVFVMRILSVFAGLCLVLTALGVYGVLSYAVEQRRKQIAIRMALGGSPKDIGREIVRQALRPAAIGIGVALICTPLIRSVLAAAASGAGELSVVSIVAAGGLLLATAIAAAAIPARRAMRTDPASTLRTE
jgi:predicted permease